jgi:ACT domain-containing protein
MSRIIISVIGKNDVGMAANICTYLAESNINILDITQTIVKEIFDMMMIVDIARAPKSFDEIAREMDELGQRIGASIRCQREEIFTSMHRI